MITDIPYGINPHLGKDQVFVYDKGLPTMYLMAGSLEALQRVVDELNKEGVQCPKQSADAADFSSEPDTPAESVPPMNVGVRRWFRRITWPAVCEVLKKRLPF